MLKGITIIVVFVFLLALILSGFCDANPVAIWTFDEGSGDTIVDSSGHGADGKITGKGLWVAGRFGKSLYFDNGAKGVDYVTIEPNKAFDLEDAVTVMCWIKPEALDGMRFLIKKEAVYEPILDGGMACFYIGNPSEAWKTPAKGGTALKADEWAHIAGTFDGNTIRIYVNGKLDGQSDYAGKIGVAPDKGIMLGANVQNNIVVRNIPPYIGAMDDAAIFDSALSEGDIKAFMTKGILISLAVRPSGKLTITWGDIKYPENLRKRF